MLVRMFSDMNHVDTDFLMSTGCFAGLPHCVSYCSYKHVYGNHTSLAVTLAPFLTYVNDLGLMEPVQP